MSASTLFELSITDFERQLNAFLNSEAELDTSRRFRNPKSFAVCTAFPPKLINAVVISSLFKNSTAFFASLVAGGFSGTVAGVLVSIYCGSTSSQLANIQDEYARSGSSNGITFTEVYMWSPTTGVGSTRYSSIIN